MMNSLTTSVNSLAAALGTAAPGVTLSTTTVATVPPHHGHGPGHD